MDFEETLTALQSLMGKPVVILISAAGAADGDHVASSFGVLARGRDYGARLLESSQRPGALTPDFRSRQGESILFELEGHHGGFCLRRDLFTRAEWRESLDPVWRDSSQRLAIQLGGVEIVVEETDTNI